MMMMTMMMMKHWRKGLVPDGDLHVSEAELEKGHEVTRPYESYDDDDDDDDPKAPDQLGEEWMTRLHDDRLMSSLSIPGTHDSAAYTTPWPFVSTQDLTIAQQLQIGIRYFDLRVGLRNDVPEMCHGLAFLGLKLDEVLDIMYEFLEKHPGEAIIAQIKQDKTPQNSTIHFSQAIFQQISRRKERWRTANTTPTLGELRGKIQLFRRFTVHHNSSSSSSTRTADNDDADEGGIDVSQWQDNPERPFTISNKLQLVTVQDHYSFADPKPLPSLIDSKGGDVANLLESAARDPDSGHWYVNFTSAFEINLFFQIPPSQIAVGGYYFLRWIDGMNARVEAYLQDRAGGKRYGIVAMDFPELGAVELVSLIILSNFEKDQRVRRRVLRGALCVLMLALVVLCGFYLVGGMSWKASALFLPGAIKAES